MELFLLSDLHSRVNPPRITPKSRNQSSHPINPLYHPLSETPHDSPLCEFSLTAMSNKPNLFYNRWDAGGLWRTMTVLSWWNAQNIEGCNWLNFHDNSSSIGISNKLDTEILFRFICEGGHHGTKALAGVWLEGIWENRRSRCLQEKMHPIHY